MLTTSTRPYTEAEFDEYADRMESDATSLTAMVLLALAAGGMSVLAAFAAHWVYAKLTSNPASWTYPLIIGGAIAVVAFLALWLTSNSVDWTSNPPKLATVVSATANAAWHAECDSLLDTLFIFRVDPDHYLVLTQSLHSPHILEPTSNSTLPDSIPSSIRLVLLGEQEFRVALDISLSGLPIPLNPLPITQDPSNLDDETPIPDGLYITQDLPPALRNALSRPPSPS